MLDFAEAMMLSANLSPNWRLAMGTCDRCGYREGGHHKDCPEVLGNGPEKREAIASCQRGWTDGRAANRLAAEPQNPCYMLGWHRGVKAAAKADNSYDSRFDH